MNIVKLLKDCEVKINRLKHPDGVTRPEHWPEAGSLVRIVDVIGDVGHVKAVMTDRHYYYPIKMLDIL